MATPNYSFAKKQRELAKKQKKAEKQQRRTGNEKPGEEATPTSGKAPPAAE